MSWFRRMRSTVHSLTAAPAAAGVQINTEADFRGEAFRHRLWYRGRPSELQQYYESYDDRVGNTSFWGARVGGRFTFRKLHTGLPALMVDTLADIVCTDLLAVRLEDEAAQVRWDEIARVNRFDRLLRRAVRVALSEGDGAFKLTVDPAVSALPILSFHGGGELDFTCLRHRLHAVTFGESFTDNGKEYRLAEQYSPQGVTYRLSDGEGKVWPLSAAAATRDLRNLENPHGFLPAVELIFDENPRFPGRGRSLYDGKTGALDAIDECVSQWVDALRDGRVQTYIPDGYMPRDPETGALLRPNAFSARFVLKEEAALEGQTPRIEVVQPEVKTGALLETHKTFLDICLQGILSPSTLGVDVRKLDNAEAQREKEKMTLYTRGRIIAVLKEAIPRLVNVSLRTLDWMENRRVQEYRATAEFGEYANPSFEAQIETVGKAVGSGIMSLETAMNELYGQGWTADQKAEEVVRLLQTGSQAGMS